MSLAATETTPTTLLDGHAYINLTTYRKNGTEVTRPVWFAVDDEKIYCITVEQSGKVKHIRNNPDVFVSPSDARGNALSTERAAGSARILMPDDPEADHANRVLNEKYGLLKRLFSLNFMLRRASVVWIEITPLPAA